MCHQLSSVLLLIGVNLSGAYILVHINLACVIVHLVFQGFSVC